MLARKQEERVAERFFKIGLWSFVFGLGFWLICSSKKRRSAVRPKTKGQRPFAIIPVNAHLSKTNDRRW